jgi:carbon catabolite-derepressing protein kinase
MEVMLEIYRTLKALGMEWREKKNLGGLGSGSIHPNGNHGGRRKNGHNKIDRAREYDGGGHVDLKAAASVYFIETRVRVQDIVVRWFPSLRHVPPDQETPGPHEPSVVYGGLDQLPG